MDAVDQELADNSEADTQDAIDSVDMATQQEPSYDGPGEMPGDRANLDSGTLDQIAQAPAPGQPTGTAQLPLGAPETPRQAVDQAYQAGEQTATAQQDKQGAIQAERDQQAKALEDRSVQARIDEQEQADLKDQHQAALSKATDEMNKSEQEVKDYKFHDFWADKSTGSKALAIIFGAVGGMGAAMAKQPNLALQEIDHAEEMDFKKQQRQLMNAQQFAAWKRDGVKDLEGRFNKEQATLELQQSKRLEHLSDYAKAQYLRTGHSKEEADNNVISQGLLQKASEKRADSLMRLYQMETGRLSKKAAMARGHGACAAGDPAVMEKLSAYATTHPGDEPGLYRMANALGLRGKGLLPAIKQVKDQSEKLAAAGEKAATARDARTITWTDGTTGLASSTRGVEVNEKLDRSYDNATDKLKALHAKLVESPIKTKVTAKFLSQYDDAVLAVSAVTIAPGTDKTTMHEAGSLKEWGTINKEAIESKIQQVEKLQNAMRRQHAPRDKASQEVSQEVSQAKPTESTGGPVEGSTSMNKGRPIVYMGGKWVLKGKVTTL